MKIFRGVAYAMAPPPGAEVTTFDTIMSFAPLVLLVVIFYFLLFRPQQKKQQDTRKMIESLKEGDSVLTTGGVYGTISRIKEDVLTLQVAEGVKVKVNRAYVVGLKTSEGSSLVHPVSRPQMVKVLYSVLGTTPDSTEDEIKKAYKHKVKITHPDKGGNTQEFELVATAYKVLGDKENRRRYDAGETWESILQVSPNPEPATRPEQ